MVIIFNYRPAYKEWILKLAKDVVISQPRSPEMLPLLTFYTIAACDEQTDRRRNIAYVAHYAYMCVTR